jgi:processive 1,2-diacylglycerol beta-glucosyltransferase
MRRGTVALDMLPQKSRNENQTRKKICLGVYLCQRKPKGTGMIKIYNKTTNELLGRVSDEELDFLIDNLEEESITDQDYYIRSETLEHFQSIGASPRLLETLRGGMRNDNAIEIRWVDELKEKTGSQPTN